MMRMTRAAIAGSLVWLCACGSPLPETRYYQLAGPEIRQSGGALVVLDTLATDAAYDDERIVYRTSPYRLDYYQYQRWSSAPGVLVGDYLEQAMAASGRLRVVRELTPNASVTLAGRVVALEEVDRSSSQWVGRVAVQLVVSDARTGDALWTERFDEVEPLHQQSPEGLAAAVSTALARIAARAVPIVAGLAERAGAPSDTRSLTKPAPSPN